MNAFSLDRITIFVIRDASRFRRNLKTGWAAKVSEEFQISLEEARKQVVAWMSQRGEFALAVSDTKEYILNKNPGVDIAVFEQHPTYTFHVASGQDSGLYGGKQTKEKYLEGENKLGKAIMKIAGFEQ